MLAGEVTWVERGLRRRGPRRHLVRHRRDRRPRRQRAGEQGGRGRAGVLRPVRRRHQRDGVDPGCRAVRRADAGRARPPRAAAYGRGPRRDRDRRCTRGPSPPANAGPSVPGVTLVGGGPGDPELISVAGRRALMEADVVVADRLAPRELLGDLPATTEVVDVAKLPRGQRRRGRRRSTGLIVERALAGQRVARFKGGDSFVFGRGFEEIEACREAGVAVHVIPGLSSPLAVPAVAGIPVTHRGGRPRLHGGLRAPAARPRRLAGRLGRRRPAARHPAADDGGRERARTSPRALVRRRPSARARRSRSSATARCRGSGPCSRRSASCGADLDRHGVRPPAIIVVGDVVAVAHPQHFARDRARPWQS